MVSEPMHGTNFIINSLSLSQPMPYLCNECECVCVLAREPAHIFFHCDFATVLELARDFKYLIVYIVHAFA